MKKILSLIAIILILSACSHESNSVDNVVVLEAEPMNTDIVNTPTIIQAEMPTHSLASTSFLPKETIKPVYDYREFSNYIESLKNCDYPCVWGITIGQTKESDLVDFLSLYGSVTKYPGKTGSSKYVYEISVPIDISSIGYLGADFYTENEIVSEIFMSTYSQYMGHDVSWQEVLRSLGKLDEIYVGGTASQGGDNVSVEVVFIYQSQGILFRLIGLAPFTNGDAILICPLDTNFFDSKGLLVYIWNIHEDKNLSPLQSLNSNLKYASIQSYNSDLSVDVFYEKFIIQEKAECYELIPPSD